MVWNQCKKCEAIFDHDWPVCPVKCESAEIEAIELSDEQIREMKSTLYVKNQTWLLSF